MRQISFDLIVGQVFLDRFVISWIAFPTIIPITTKVRLTEDESKQGALFHPKKCARLGTVSRKQTFSRLPSISGQIFENWIVYPTINYIQSKMQLIENKTKKDILTL